MHTKDYTVLYARRKTVSLILRDGGALEVRAPIGTPTSEIERIIEKHRRWLQNARERQQKRAERSRMLTEEEIRALRRAAKTYFSEKLPYYANIIGLKYGRMSITSARTRFGSCNSKGNICFSYRLMLYPEAAREYVVVHELAHLLEMNHSKRFYEIIEGVLPDYKERQRLLR